MLIFFQLMLVFMTNDYESDSILSELFLYCRNVLKKPYIIINYSNDLDWQGSLGMIIGAQEVRPVM